MALKGSKKGTTDTTNGTVLESHTQQRTFIKSLTWRILATGTTILIAFLLTGALAQALSVGIPDFFVKFIVYYAHERLWLLTALQQLKSRVLFKMVSWKLIAVSLSMAVTFYVSGSLKIALKLGPIDFGIKTLSFYLHEKLWDSIEYGRKVEAEIKEDTTTTTTKKKNK